MSYPNIWFVDAAGIPFNADEDGITHVRQFGGAWYVELDCFWPGGVALDGAPPLPLVPVPNIANRWELPRGRGGEVIRRAGEVTVVLTDRTGNLVNDAAAILHIYPANISEWQIDRMVSDIGILALSTACCVRRSVPVPLGEGFGTEGLGQQWVAGHGMLATATALLELASVVQDNWSEIQKRPLRSFATEIGPVEVGAANLSPQLLIKSKVEPGKRRVLGITRVESSQCPENEFLCYILDVYLRDLASGLASSLESLSLETAESNLIPTNARRKDQEFQKFLELSRYRIQSFRLQQEKIKQHISSKVSQLQACASWAIQARSSAFLENVSTPEEVPTNTLRLIESPTYGPIFATYSNSRGGVFEPIQKILYLFERIYRGEVRPTWEIYEIWCLIKLYSAFILYANMQPAADRPTLFESLLIENNGIISIPKNQTFSIEGRLDSGKKFSVTLEYEPRLFNRSGELRTPDILIHLRIDGLIKKYVFDSKYRNYSKQGVEQFSQDVIAVAKNRYLEELSLSASLILHTDSAKDFWGEVPLERFLLEEFELDLDLDTDELEYPGHTYGAIALTPGQNEERQVRRILRLLLQYHDSDLCTSCLPCGQELEWGVDVHSSWKPDRISEEELIGRVVYREGRSGNGTGLYCSCPECGSFWVVQSCYGPHHHLLKFKDCFHRNSDHPEFKGKWMYICPACGSDPSLDELRTTSQPVATNLDYWNLFL